MTCATDISAFFLHNLHHNNNNKTPIIKIRILIPDNRSFYYVYFIILSNLLFTYLTEVLLTTSYNDSISIKLLFRNCN